MQVQKLIIVFLLASSFVYADDEESCMDKAQELAVGLKLTEHLLYMVEHLNAGKGSVDELCAQPFRTKYYEADLEKFNVPLIQARKDLKDRGVTSSMNFPYLRTNKIEMLNMQQVCQLVEKHLAKNNRCMEPRKYMERLITKKILSNPFDQNCSKLLPEVQVNVGSCYTRKK